MSHPDLLYVFLPLFEFNFASPPMRMINLNKRLQKKYSDRLFVPNKFYLNIVQIYFSRLLGESPRSMLSKFSASSFFSPYTAYDLTIVSQYSIYKYQNLGLQGCFIASSNILFINCVSFFSHCLF